MRPILLAVAAAALLAVCGWWRGKPAAGRPARSFNDTDVGFLQA